LVLRPLDVLWRGRDADVIARVGSAYEHDNWDMEAWRAASCRVGATATAMLNAGVVVFQNHAHRRIHSSWPRLISQFLSGELPAPFTDSRMPEQWALALAIGSANLHTSLLDATDHSYAWTNEGSDETVVLHTGRRLFDDCATAFGIDASPISPVRGRTEDQVQISKGLERTIVGLNRQVARLEHEIGGIKASRTYALGSMFASLSRTARAMLRFDVRDIARELRAGWRSLKKVSG
jgi:hypothetical protein